MNYNRKISYKKPFNFMDECQTFKIIIKQLYIYKSL